ncbi:hypothetical protein [Siminovitchia sp. FSL W7-1587]|uniref:hypothetical protein n=1 Tax=Siminovitchia sp. FSL W7-1587 TaxID=2954699 RepID=UPI0030CE2FF0
MASITVYKLNTAEQLDLFYTTEGKLNLNKVQEEMNTKFATIGQDGRISGQGFLNPQIKTREDIQLLEAYGTDLINLGNYFDTVFDEDDITTNEAQFTFYSKARIIITEDSDLVLRFENSTEEKVRGKIKALVESLGFEASLLKIDDILLRKIMDNDLYDWSAAKIDRVDKDGDKTTKVSYEIDLANDLHPSEVDEAYRKYGKISHIKFQLPISRSGAPDSITINLYNNGHRAYFETNELGTFSIDNFTVFLMKKLKSI